MGKSYFLFSIYLVVVLLVGLPLSSALEFDNVKSYDAVKKEITITNAFGLGSDLAKYKLYYSENSVIDAWAEGNVILYNDGKIFENMKFLDKGNKERTIPYSIFYYKYNTVEVSIPEYELSCTDIKDSKNGSKDCKYVIINYRTETQTVKEKVPYKYETLKAGSYDWRIEAKKPINVDVDWQGVTLGQTLNEWSWWNGTFAYKKKITLTENSGTNLYNFTKNFMIPYNSHMGSPSFKDMKFTDSSENVELKYWIEGKNDSSMVSVWVKIPTLLASSGTDIYMYYGNTSYVTDRSNISQAFLFGDDFEDGVMTNWDTTAGFVEKSGYLKDVSGLGTQIQSTYQGYNVTRGILETSMGSQLSSQRWVTVQFQKYESSNWYMAGSGYGDLSGFIQQGFGTFINCIPSSSGCTALGGGWSATEYALNVSYRWTVKYTPTSKNVTMLNNPSVVAMQNTSSNALVSGNIGVFGYDTGGYWNWIALRNYSSVEPSYSIGSETTDTPFPTLVLNQPSINYYNTTNSILFNCSANLSVGIINLTLVIDGVNNYTVYNSSANQNLSLQTTLGFNEGLHNWTCDARGSANGQGTQPERFFIVDRTSPNVSIAYPTTTSYISSLPTSDSIRTFINYTCNDSHYSSCILFNGTRNITLSYGSTSTYVNVTWGTYTYYLFGNDTFGNNASATVSPTYTYSLKQNSVSYTSNASEGQTDTYTINITLGTGQIYNYAYLIYDGVPYLVTATADGNTYVLSNTRQVPVVSSNTTKTFYWSINLLSGQYNSSTYSQTISNLNIDDCTVYGVKILEYNVTDEDTQIQLNASSPLYNTTVELNVKIFSYGTDNVLMYFNHTYNDQKSAKVCLETSPSGKYRIDIVGKYSETNYQTEFYYVNNGTLNMSSQYLDTYAKREQLLYTLPTTLATPFVMTFRDKSGSVRPNAILHVFSYYIGNGTFTEVERALFDNNGQTVVYVVQENALYYFVVSENSSVIFTSSQTQAKCTSTVCSIYLVDVNTGMNWSQFDDIYKNYVITDDKTTRTVQLTYTADSSQTVNLSLYTYNSQGVFTLINSTSATGLAGTLILSVPNSYGNQTFYAKMYVDGYYIKTHIINFGHKAIDYFGTFGAILGGLFIIAIAFMSLSEGALIMILSVVFGIILIVVMALIQLNWLALISFICIIGAIVFKMISRRRVN